MIRSLKRYIYYFYTILLHRKERKFIFRDFSAYYLTKAYLHASYDKQEKKLALDKAIQWLITAQMKMYDKGFGTYRIVEGWTSSYPETTGYILPTVFNYIEFTQDPTQNQTQTPTQTLQASLIGAADWLVKIQKKSGGWQSMYIADNRNEVVFNTAQVIRGLIATYKQTQNETYLQAIRRGCDWLCDIQDPGGYWEQFAFMNVSRVYDSYVDHPLLQAWQLTANERYKQTALKNLEWIITQKQQPNGWFQDCDNTLKHNNRPITHTIAYTLDGLLECALILNDNRFLQAAQRPADLLLEQFMQHGILHGRYDSNWQGSEYLICTGAAQLSIVWLKLYRQLKIEKYLQAATSMNQLLLFIQNRNFEESSDTKGAMPGSFPIWGKYETFAFPNWATKYLADALLLELQLVQ